MEFSCWSPPPPLCEKRQTNQTGLKRDSVMQRYVFINSNPPRLLINHIKYFHILRVLAKFFGRRSNAYYHVLLAVALWSSLDSTKEGTHFKRLAPLAGGHIVMRSFFFRNLSSWCSGDATNSLWSASHRESQLKGTLSRDWWPSPHLSLLFIC